VASRIFGEQLNEAEERVEGEGMSKSTVKSIQQAMSDSSDKDAANKIY
jgi:hypothetical protein